MLYSFTIHGETPSKKNSRIINTKTGRSFPSKKYSQWHETATAELITQQKPERPIDSPVLIVLRFTHGDLQRRDSDNGTSSILDLLTDCGVLADDSWSIVRTISIMNYYEKNAPRCDITIQDIPEEMNVGK